MTAPALPVGTEQRVELTRMAKSTAPFIRKATSADIIAKVQRGRDALNQIKSTTDH